MAAVAIAWPVRPARSRVEWLVGEFERAGTAIDELIAGGYLTTVDGDEHRLELGPRRWPDRQSATPSDDERATARCRQT